MTILLGSFELLANPSSKNVGQTNHFLEYLSKFIHKHCIYVLGNLMSCVSVSWCCILTTPLTTEHVIELWLSNVFVVKRSCWSGLVLPLNRQTVDFQIKILAVMLYNLYNFSHFKTFKEKSENIHLYTSEKKWTNLRYIK